MAGNTSSGAASDISTESGTVTGSYNLIGTGGSGGLSNGVDGNIVGVVNPGLSQLGNYGGPTQTIALLPGSPALAAGTATGAPATDQRGVVRTGGVDIGAFQSQGFVVTITGGNNQTGVVGSSFADPLSVTVTANDTQEPVAGGVVSFSAPASGASASFTGNPAVIGADGLASVSAMANSMGGTYAVTASTGAVSTSFSLTNVAQPTFSNLAAPTITYGTATATLGGTILAGSFVPTGDVNITVDNVTEQAAIDGSGDFSFAFPTATLGVAGAPYTITYAYAGNATFQPVTDSSQVLSVSKASVEVTADNQSKVYGAADPVLTYTVTGLVNSDPASVITGVTLSTTTGAAATAGTHTITASGGTAANYAITDVNGTFSVSQAALTVTADNQSKVYGGADPTLTYTPSGTLYYGDTYSVITGVTLSTATGAAATAGTHTIMATGGTAANYAITDVNGILTVSQAALTVTADNQSKVYGGADPTLTYTPSGTLYYGDTYSVITGVSLSTATARRPRPEPTPSRPAAAPRPTTPSPTSTARLVSPRRR